MLRLRHLFSQLPLQTVLTIPFVIQTVAVVGIVGYLSFKNGQKTVQTLSAHLRSELVARINQQLTTTVEQPYIINQINANSFLQGDIDILTGEGQHQFWQQVKVFPATNLVYCATETDGAFLGVGRSNGGIGQVLQAYTANPKTDRFMYTYGINDFGQRTHLQEKGIEQYDPRIRPWYEAAKARGEPTWSKVYLDFETLLPTITATTPVFSDQTQQLLGVCATDIILSEELNRFLHDLQISKSGIAYIVEPSGALIASSTSEATTKGNGHNTKLIHASDSKNPLIRHSVQHLSGKFQGLESVTSDEVFFTLEGETHYLEVVRFSDNHGLDWIVVLVVPESDFMEQINRNTQMTLALSILALLLTTVMGALITQWLTRPLNDLNERAKEIATGKWNEAVELDRGDVIGDLSRSFSAMAIQLKESFNTLEHRIEARTAELSKLNQELQRLANIDGLTQIANRRYFDQCLENEWETLILSREPLSLVLCDVDFFKKYNDTYGHQAGDTCLQQVAEVLKSSVHRATDLVARYGGEEFAIILSNTDEQGAMHVAQVMFKRLEKLAIPHQGTETGRITVSMGISTVVPTVRRNLRSLLTETDLALYEAKAKGRNQFCLSSHSSKVEELRRC